MKIRAPFIVLSNEKKSAPLYRQIYEAVRQAILGNHLHPNSKIPASRALAAELGVSRITVVNAYEQLLAEGYLEGKTGAGTFVASKLPEDLLQISKAKEKNEPSELRSVTPKLSVFARNLTESRGRSAPSDNLFKTVPFRNGLTAVDEFPFEIWEKIAVRVLRKSRSAISGYGEAEGYRPLRAAVAAHLSAARGVHCGTEQIFITNGAQQALDLIGRVLLENGDFVWLEDPCYREAFDIFKANGAQIVPIPVDNEGFDLSTAERQKLPAKFVYVTPSHQYPLGVTMSLARRLNLLEWARRKDAWIIEDDYNSEFRYRGRPLASLQNLDEFGRVIYVGTFSKTIFPALRLGCLVVPQNLIEAFRAARSVCDLHSPIFEQMILAEFIAEGHFSRHLRRMRTLYEKRQKCLVAEIQKELDEFIKLGEASSGMHLIGWLSQSIDDREFSAKLAAAGLSFSPLSAYCLKAKLPPGVILGYTGFGENEIRQGVEKAAQVLKNEANFNLSKKK